MPKAGSSSESVPQQSHRVGHPRRHEGGIYSMGRTSKVAAKVHHPEARVPALVQVHLACRCAPCEARIRIWASHCKVPPNAGVPLPHEGKAACIADLSQNVHVNAYFLLYSMVSRTAVEHRSQHASGQSSAACVGKQGSGDHGARMEGQPC